MKTCKIFIKKYRISLRRHDETVKNVHYVNHSSVVGKAGLRMGVSSSFNDTLLSSVSQFSF